MVETNSEANVCSSMDELREILQGEAESLENIYSDEGVIVAYPELIQVPKHVLAARLAEENKAMAMAADTQGGSAEEVKAKVAQPSLAQLKLQEHIRNQRKQQQNGPSSEQTPQPKAQNGKSGNRRNNNKRGGKKGGGAAQQNNSTQQQNENGAAKHQATHQATHQAMQAEVAQDEENATSVLVAPITPIVVVLDQTPVDVVQLLLNFTPEVGHETTKIAVSLTMRLLFQIQFPKSPPRFEFTAMKGLDDDQVDMLKRDIVECLQRNCNQETEDIDGILYQLYQDLRDCLSQYNDTLRGRCSVCLEPFCRNADELETQTFTDRVDLVRIDNCFHRFHILCVYRDWFMERAKDTDEFGGIISYDLPEVKRCPICRSEAEEADIGHIQGVVEQNPQLKRTLSKY